MDHNDQMTITTDSCITNTLNNGVPTDCSTTPDVVATVDVGGHGHVTVENSARPGLTSAILDPFPTAIDESCKILTDPTCNNSPNAGVNCCEPSPTEDAQFSEMQHVNGPREIGRPDEVLKEESCNKTDISAESSLFQSSSVHVDRSLADEQTQLAFTPDVQTENVNITPEVATSRAGHADNVTRSVEYQEPQHGTPEVTSGEAMLPATDVQSGSENISFPATTVACDQNGGADVIVSAGFEQPLEETQCSVEYVSQNEALPVEQEVPKIDFTSGIKCHDATDAVEILKTRYRMTDVSIHKNSLTWSCWNIADMIRGPHRESHWWKSRSLARETKLDTTEIKNILTEDISDDAMSDEEMEEVCKKIDLKEKQIAAMIAASERAHASPAVATPDEVAPTAAPTTESAKPPKSEAPPGGRRENIFHRMMRALRKRFSRQQRQPTT